MVNGTDFNILRPSIGNDGQTTTYEQKSNDDAPVTYTVARGNQFTPAR